MPLERGREAGLPKRVSAACVLGRGVARQWAYIFALLAKMELNVLCGDEVRFRAREEMNILNKK